MLSIAAMANTAFRHQTARLRYCTKSSKCKLIGLILLNTCLVNSAQAFSWEQYRDEFLGPMRDELMMTCADGKYANSNGLSYWDQRLTNKAKQRALNKGWTIQKWQDFSAGQAAAMGKACPNVW